MTFLFWGRTHWPEHLRLCRGLWDAGVITGKGNGPYGHDVVRQLVGHRGRRVQLMWLRNQIEVPVSETPFLSGWLDSNSGPWNPGLLRTEHQGGWAEVPRRGAGSSRFSQPERQTSKGRVWSTHKYSEKSPRRKIPSKDSTGNKTTDLGKCSAFQPWTK